VGFWTIYYVWGELVSGWGGAAGAAGRSGSGILEYYCPLHSVTAGGCGICTGAGAWNNRFCMCIWRCITPL